MTTGELCRYLEQQIPPALQESYDNSGLQTGSYEQNVTSILLTIDVNEEVVAEAVAKGCNLIISHHPLIFSPLKRVTSANPVQRTLIAAIKSSVSIYSAHTNLDSVYGGVSFKMASKLQLVDIAVLAPVSEKLVKLVTFVPNDHLEKVREAIFSSGAGHIGNYDSCSYQMQGEGTFRGNENATPFAGTRGTMHSEPEIRLETIMPSFITGKVVKALTEAHPYEEPAFDIYPLLNRWSRAGMGCSGSLKIPLDTDEFLNLVKQTFASQIVRYSGHRNKKIKKVAVCGGAGISLLKEAIASEADAFVTGDVKYHQFADAERDILLVDAGHYETEKFSMEIIYDLIIKKFPNFALRFSETITNPINYY
jgi:dinuclear metal center YbgI/SA1388 family protein